MKKNVVLLVGIMFANVLSAQTTLNDLIKGCTFSISEYEKMETIEYTNSRDENVNYSIDEIASLLRKDVISYYDLSNKHNTELKIKTYKQTEDYRNKYNTMMQDYNRLTQGKGYLLYNLRYNSNYNVAKHCFMFKIGFDDLYRYAQPGYLCFENGIALTYPAAYLSRTKQNTNLATNGAYNYNILKTTTISEATASKIENEMENPYCNARLLIIFKLTNAVKEKKVVGGYYIPQNFIIGKTIGAYLVNEKTGEVYADMSSIFSQTVNNRKPTIQNKR